MSFIKECFVNGNGTIRGIIIAVVLAVTLVPMIIKGCVAEHDSYVKSYNEAAKLLQKGE